MFYVDKTTVSRYWFAYAGHIEERVGMACGNEGEYDSEQTAYAYAERNLHDRLNYNLRHIRNRYSSIALAVYRIKALWNSKIREGLSRYEQELIEAASNVVVPPEIQVKRAPDQIPVLGTRLPIGTTVYIVDSHDARLHVGKVVAEYISYYDFRPEGVAAYYALDNKMSVESTLKSNYSNHEIYLDRDKATSRLRELMTIKAKQINEQLKSLL